LDNNDDDGDDDEKAVFSSSFSMIRARNDRVPVSRLARNWIRILYILITSRQLNAAAQRKQWDIIPRMLYDCD
jgi:hypothetical protein